MSQMKLGCGIAKITPGLGVFMAGYFEERKATAIHDDLYARALVFKDDDVTAALLCCDVISIHRNQVAAIQKRVAGHTEIKPENVMVCATHTHTGPVTRMSRVKEGAEPTLQWLDSFPERAAQAVIDAASNLEACEIFGASSQEDRIAFNRRYRMRDGSVRTNPGHQHPDIIEPAGPIDPEVGILAFTRQDGSIKALFVNYACHLDNVGGTEISADFPGYLVRRLQERLKDRPFVLFTNGACGDINHIDVRSPFRRKGHEHSRWMGGTLAGDVCEALKDKVSLSNSGVKTARETIQLLMKEDADAEIGRAEIQAIRVGEIGFVGVPAEYFVELQLDIKKRSPFKRTFVSELTNGSVGYIPTRKAFEENMKHVSAERMQKFDHMGYEVRSALSRGFLPGVGEQMADTAVALLEELSNVRLENCI